MKFKDIEIGRRYNAWTVIDLNGTPSGTILCQCVCGTTQSLARKHLVEGRSKRCKGCKVVPRHDHTGERIGHLVALRFCEVRSSSRTRQPLIYWICKCDCGNEVQVSSKSFMPSQKLSATNRSCGCNRFGDQGANWRGHEGLPGTYWHSVKKHAGERGIEFTLVIEEMWDLFVKQEGKCALTGQPLTITARGTRIGTASIDRIDSDKGYSIDNVQWVHKHINQMKLDHSSEYFAQMCKLVAEHHKDQ